MKPAYFWDGEQVITLMCSVYTEQAQPYLGMYCIDTQHADDDMRYGQFIAERGWIPVPLADFPPEFRTTLLLLT